MYQRTVPYKEAIVRAMTTNYFNFSGRSSRSEYWWFCLFCCLVNWFLPLVFIIALSFSTDMDEDTMIRLSLVIPLVISLAFIIPGIAVAVRRLHDIGRSGWYMLIGVIPYIGAIILIIWFCKESQPCDNQYGPIPNLE